MKYLKIFIFVICLGVTVYNAFNYITSIYYKDYIEYKTITPKYNDDIKVIDNLLFIRNVEVRIDAINKVAFDDQNRTILVVFKHIPFVKKLNDDSYLIYKQKLTKSVQDDVKGTTLLIFILFGIAWLAVWAVNDFIAKW